MVRPAFGPISGTHITVMVCTALLVPGALLAAATFTNVAVTDSTTGTTAKVDAGRRLTTTDTIAGYTNNPLYLANVAVYSTNNNGYQQPYTIPTGKVLLIKSILWSYDANNEGVVISNFLFDNNLAVLASFEGQHVADTVSATFEAPIVVRAGMLKSQFYPGASNSTSRIYIQGYLVPASVVPAPATAEAAEQFVAGKTLNEVRPR